MRQAVKPRTTILPVLLTVGMALAGPVRADFDFGGSTKSPEPSMTSAVDAVEEGDYEEAVRRLREYLEERSDDADALNLMGYSLRKLEKFEESEEFYLRALEIDPKHLGANEYLGELYLQTGRPELARERLAVLKEVCPDSCEEREQLKTVLGDYSDGEGP